MAKDPAFLFYPGDWLGGTMSFSRYHKGAYMDLLMCQFNQGHMELQDIEIVLGEKDFSEMWESKLKNKFTKDAEGKFYNEKLENEIIKRKNYTKSRRNNLKSNDDMQDHMDTHKEKHKDNHMTEHMENGNYNVNEIDKLRISIGEEKFLIPEMLELLQKSNPSYPRDINLDYKPLQKIATFINNQSKLNGNAIENKKIVIGIWTGLCDVISKDNFYNTKSLSVISNHIQEIYQLQKNGKHTTTSAGITRKKGTSELRTDVAKEW